MPKPRKPLGYSVFPPTRTGWYAYSHVEGPWRVAYLSETGLKKAQDRYRVCLAMNIPFTDRWSTRRLKKRERQ